MRSWFRITLALLLCGGLVVPFPSRAQEKSTKDQKKDDKERQKREKALRDELKDGPYKNWLDVEVAYIISESERRAFLQLSTNEEREEFIEQFWLRRDPTPDTVENEEKEEHYRRIAYANERFASGKPGWKTDRGRIYIMHGPPDAIESHPTGGAYDRPGEEGGGTTTTYPWERWRYRYIEGIGNNVEVEFVDKTNTNEYRLTMDPSEKDALLLVPGAGLTMLESMGVSSKVDRFHNTDGSHLGKPLGAITRQYDEFERLDLFYKIQKTPEVKFKDLEALVTTRIIRNPLHFNHRIDFLRIAGDTVLVPITVQIPNRQLTFEAADDIHNATLNLFARITTLTGRRVQTFEDVITRSFPDSLFKTELEGSSIYQKAVPLRPGLYRLDIVIKDLQSGNVGVVNTRLAVPRYDEEQLAVSSLILADQILRVPSREIGLGQFVLGASKVRPRMDSTFTSNEKLGIYLQIYNLKVDEVTQKTDATIEYVVRKGNQDLMRFTESSAELQQTGQQLTIEKLMALGTLDPGKYQLKINVTDNVSKQTIPQSPTAEFTVKAAEKTTAQK